MAEKTEKVFADGLVFTPPSDNAPEFVLGRIWVRVDKFKEFLDAHNTNNGGVNIDIKRSTKGNVYCELSTWKPSTPAGLVDATSQTDEVTSEEINPADIPF